MRAHGFLGGRDLIANRAADHALRAVARRAGMRTLFEDGIAKAARGLTTLDEVLRIVAPGDAGQPAVAAAPPVETRLSPPAPAVVRAASATPPTGNRRRFRLTA